MGNWSLLHAHVRVRDCVWFRIGMQSEIGAVQCRLRMRRVNLKENTSESYGCWLSKAGNFCLCFSFAAAAPAVF